jgi:hypothetical protein
MTVFGPYDTEAQASAEPLPTAVRALPIDTGQLNAAMRDLQLSHLREACIDAGIEMGRHDARILAWLATYEATTVQVVIGLISRAAAAKPVGRAANTFLLWSNKHEMWWRANESGYTTFVEEAGRYPYDRAAQIVRRSSCDGQLLQDRTDPVTERVYLWSPTVLVLAPECVDLEGGVTRG